MTVTSAEANKLLKRLQDEYRSIANLEAQSMSFVAAVGEDIETVRPEYDFAATDKALEELNLKIRTIKHAVNLFNTTHTVPGFDVTVDEMLVLLPQMNQKLIKLASMKNTLPKTRANDGYRSSSGSIIEYKYANYDIAEVKAEYDRLSEEVAAAQLALDTLNTTVKFDIPAEL